MKRFRIEVTFSTLWTLVALLVAFAGGLALAAGSATRMEGNMLVLDGTTGNNGWAMDVNGLRGDLGTGADDYWESNGTYITTPSYVASQTPFTMFVTYINNTVAALTYGGFVSPARDFQVVAVRFRVRTAGSGGSTDNTIRITDGVSNCDCTFACNTASGTNVRAACGTDANCDFEASDSMTVSVLVGDCAVATDIIGNVEFETLWE